MTSVINHGPLGHHLTSAEGMGVGISLHMVIRSSVLITELASLRPVCSLPPLQSAHERKSVMECMADNSANESKVRRLLRVTFYHCSTNMQFVCVELL